MKEIYKSLEIGSNNRETHICGRWLKK